MARASCGDYVVYRSKEAVEGHGAARSKSPLPAPAKQPAGPCHGPRCSKQSAPPMTPAPVAPTVVLQWGCLLNAIVSIGAEVSTAIDTVKDTYPVYFTQPILHPPRAL